MDGWMDGQTDDMSQFMEAIYKDDCSSLISIHTM